MFDPTERVRVEKGETPSHPLTRELSRRESLLGEVADGEKTPSHPLARELSRRESLFGLKVTLSAWGLTGGLQPFLVIKQKFYLIKRRIN